MIDRVGTSSWHRNQTRRQALERHTKSAQVQPFLQRHLSYQPCKEAQNLGGPDPPLP